MSTPVCRACRGEGRICALGEDGSEWMVECPPCFGSGEGDEEGPPPPKPFPLGTTACVLHSQQEMKDHVATFWSTPAGRSAIAEHEEH